MSRLAEGRRLVADIKKRYPDPVPSGGYGYCVGGAFVKYVNGDVPFPNGDKLTRELEQNNPELRGAYKTGTETWARYFARRIISANDSGNMTGAWHWLEEALAFERAYADRVPATV